MTPYWQSDDQAIYHGECRAVLDSLTEKSVQVCCTSPPYFALRAYPGVEPSVWGATDPSCGHEWGEETIRVKGGAGQNKGLDNSEAYREARDVAAQTLRQGCFCRRCGAWKGTLGNEPTPFLYVDHLVEVFRHVYRVLRDDGLLVVVIGDSYATRCASNRRNIFGTDTPHGDERSRRLANGIKETDLCLVPEMLALAMRQDGWWVRSRICWAKRANMPEPVRSRPVSAHETIWLFSKAQSYFYDADAVRRPYNQGSLARYDQPMQNLELQNHTPSRTRPRANTRQEPNPLGANLRNVWTDIPDDADDPDSDFWLLSPDQLREGAHHAPFPREIPRRCLRMGTSEKGCCARCGTTWRRVHLPRHQPVAPCDGTTKAAVSQAEREAGGIGRLDGGRRSAPNSSFHNNPSRRAALHVSDAFVPGCACGAPTVPCVVLDPFVGSGTTLVVARSLGRHGIGIDASAEYCALTQRRVEKVTPSLPLHQVMTDEPSEAVEQMGLAL